MLKRPSTRRKSHQNEITLNLVPILDSLVALISFLLFTMSFLVFVAIDSPFPEIKTEILSQPIFQKPLQLTLSIHETDTEIWSPFDRLQPIRVPHLNGAPDLQGIHENLLKVKQQFPEEKQAVIVPNDRTTYDSIIGIVDAARMNRADGSALFPEVVFGNLISTVNSDASSDGSLSTPATLPSPSPGVGP